MHEFNAGVQLLAKCLDGTPGLEVDAHPQTLAGPGEPVELRTHVDRHVRIADDAVRPAARIRDLAHPGDLVLELHPAHLGEEEPDEEEPHEGEAPVVGGVGSPVNPVATK